MTTPRISVVLPLLCPTSFLQSMAAFSIVTLRLHADNPFELVIAEAAYDTFDPKRDQGTGEDVVGGIKCSADVYLNFTPKIGAVRESNQAIRTASGDIIVATGSDVIVPPHWDTHLLRCFEERKDCGAASLSAFEPGAVVGPTVALNHMVEGFYSPFMAWRKGWEWSEDYIKIYQDSDLILRMYESGLRAYRSCRAHVHHLCRMTSDRVDSAQHDLDLAADEKLFYQRWGASPLAMFGVIRSGNYRYGSEHESWTSRINLHHTPDK